MAVARSMSKREFVLECDKSLAPEQQTTFFLTPLSSKHQIEIDDMRSKGDGMFIEIAYEKKDENGVIERRETRSPIAATDRERSDAIVVRALIGWENYKDGAGNELDFSKLTPDERVNLLYPEWRDEISSFVSSLNYPTEAELKN